MILACLTLAGAGFAFANGMKESSTGVPKVIKVGTLYAQSGSFATASMGEYHGLQFWAKEANKNGGYHFNAVFTVFPGQELSLMEYGVGKSGVQYTYSYPTPPLSGYNNVNFGLGLKAFTKAYESANGVSSVNFLNIAGYTAGLVVQKALENATSLSQQSLRQAVAGFSGKMTTLDGHFKIASDGAQEGELLPVCQFQPSGGSLKPVIVYPARLATGTADYPAPTS